ncbi:unnamed protein product [Brugia timori]|uniref:Uncharacterized protein n=1 Tax=Brugia timori TaxID=42155 RepID=A0A0R3R1C1_9BILA|nr:unnamed protein product [Brugia timori]
MKTSINLTSKNKVINDHTNNNQSVILVSTRVGAYATGRTTKFEKHDTHMSKFTFSGQTISITCCKKVDHEVARELQ